MEPTKRCINFMCKRRDMCPHGKKQETYLKAFTAKERESYKVSKMFPSINPVHVGCERYKD